tara:strand:+ start:65 stop:766 length:702 start_codon:yes stop_codon:yes gene_type:complete
MAINVDTVYQRVLTLCNKEQRGLLTPQEFNLMANLAQMSIFESYFFDKSAKEQLETPTKDKHTTQGDLNELIAKKLKPFTTIETVTSAHTFPTNYQTGKIFYNDRVCRKVEMNEILRMADSVRHMGGTDPVYAENVNTGRDIIVYSPSTVVSSGVTCEVINKPADVAWGYVVVNEEALYNSNTSTNFTLHDSEEDTLVFKILELAGIVINKEGIMTLGSQLQLAEAQTQKLQQ